jgi:putative nucleotidyltransferase with HDIG domain
MEPVHLIRMSDDRGLDVVAATFADLVDARTPRQGRHAARVGILAARIATRLGLPEEVVLDLRRAGLLHDIGKLGVPAAVFEKPAELNAAEREAVAAHAQLSARILERCDALKLLGELVRHHHEPMDAPERFPTLESPLRSIAARILALADRFAGMTAERPYRPSLTAAQAIAELEASTDDRLANQALRALKSVV